jgi:tetratricopeptide (TPR) repeat protein
MSYRQYIFSILTILFIYANVYPETAYEYFREGVAYHKEGDLESAIEYYDKALEMDSELKFAWSNKGYALQNLGVYDEALKCYYNAFEIDSGFADAWYNKACLHAMLGEEAKMIYSLRKAIQFKEELREYAKQDPDFKDFKDNPGFLELIGSD